MEDFAQSNGVEEKKRGFQRSPDLVSWLFVSSVVDLGHVNTLPKCKNFIKIYFLSRATKCAKMWYRECRLPAVSVPLFLLFSSNYICVIQTMLYKM